MMSKPFCGSCGSERYVVNDGRVLCADCEAPFLMTTEVEEELPDDEEEEDLDYEFGIDEDDEDEEELECQMELRALTRLLNREDALLN